MSYYAKTNPVHLTKINDNGKLVLKCGTRKRFPRITNVRSEATCKKCTGQVQRRATPSISEDLTGKLIHSSWGYDMTHNEFYKIVSQTKKTVKAVKVGSDGYGGFSGDERPNPDKVLEGGKEFTFQARPSWNGSIYFVNRQVYGEVFSLDSWNRSYYYNTLD